MRGDNSPPRPLGAPVLRAVPSAPMRRSEIVDGNDLFGEGAVVSGRCRCGISDVAPWRGHDLPFSLASVVAGLITLLVAVVAVGASLWAQ